MPIRRHDSERAVRTSALASRAVDQRPSLSAIYLVHLCGLLPWIVDVGNLLGFDHVIHIAVLGWALDVNDRQSERSDCCSAVCTCSRGSLVVVLAGTEEHCALLGGWVLLIHSVPTLALVDSLSTGFTLGLTCRLLVHLGLGRGVGDAGGGLLVRAAFILDGSGREDQLLMTQCQAFKRVLVHVDLTRMVRVRHERLRVHAREDLGAEAGGSGE
mmetsp:Transcript_22353/g.31582  ORF Transcript_22353/g.31582 Transcript_22353/m.31582 type:complete len:214 (+) Transcript_22353:286-927(+)